MNRKLVTGLVMFLFLIGMALTPPVMASQIVDVDLGNGSSGFQIEGSSLEWLDINQTPLLNFSQTVEWAALHGYKLATVAEMSVLLDQLMADKSFSLTEAQAMGGIKISNNSWYMQGYINGPIDAASNPAATAWHQPEYFNDGAGFCSLSGGASHSFLNRETVAATPEPATYLLLATGMFGLAYLRKKLKH